MSLPSCVPFALALALSILLDDLTPPPPLTLEASRPANQHCCVCVTAAKVYCLLFAKLCGVVVVLAEQVQCVFVAALHWLTVVVVVSLHCPLNVAPQVAAVVKASPYRKKKK